MKFENLDWKELKGASPTEILERMFETVDKDVVPILWNMLTGRQQKQTIRVNFDQYLKEPPWGLHLAFRAQHQITIAEARNKVKKIGLPEKAFVTLTDRVSFPSDIHNVIGSVYLQSSRRLEEMIFAGEKRKILFQMMHHLSSDDLLCGVAIQLTPDEREPQVKAGSPIIPVAGFPNKNLNLN